jgi:Transcription factor WhiB
LPRPKPGLLIDGHVPEAPWHADGNCRLPQFGLSGYALTSLFYSEEDEDIELAKTICQSCQIRAMCLETALAFKEPEGVWGGMSPVERRSILRKRRKGVA